MTRTNAQTILWVGVTFALTVFLLQVPTASSGTSNGPTIRLGFGWTEVTGELLNIKCADPDPVKIETQGFPFARQYTEYICTGENQITTSRTNTIGAALNAFIAAALAGTLVYAGTRYFWKR